MPPRSSFPPRADDEVARQHFEQQRLFCQRSFSPSRLSALAPLAHRPTTVGAVTRRRTLSGSLRSTPRSPLVQRSPRHATSEASKRA
eukprot:CAMPEP_0185164474 /NCGR_PEP_ID=MMETSP1139-20130426/9439_1 /TAXON_ID=298111 /ORGANISM="Pavlova sp., Strain CCMP459" /LENGTH=86 /DNA_ID=CAMNT_0027729853 /DNA_START=29 /DNA_END=289 /DNA_ORIENTATION=+